MSIIIGEASELNIAPQKVCDFYAQHWKRRIALSRLSFYQWQFISSPSDAGKDRCMVAFDESSNQLCGAMGLNSRPFFLEGVEKKGAELTTWIVEEKYWSRGIGPGILKKIQEKYDVLIGMGISDMALPIYMLLGFRFLRAIPRHVKVFNFDAIKKYAQYQPLAERLIKQWHGLGNDVRFKLEPVTDDRIKGIEEIAQRKLNHFSRQHKFLEWRYSKHPLFKYKQFFIQSTNSSKGKGVYVCLREETNIDNLRILHVLDCIGDENDMAAAVSFIQNYSIENNIYLADFYCTTTHISRYFTTAGWFSIVDDAYFQFPHLFHPIELTIPPTTSLAYWSKDNQLDLANISKLYITKQDADFDRPTLETYEKFSK